MIELDRALLRSLAEWRPDVPVTSVYLSVDGRAHPRKVDYELHLDELLRKVRVAADRLDTREARRSVLADADRVEAFVMGSFDRGATRGLAVFSASAAELWEVVELPRSVRNRAEVARIADLLQLEAMLEQLETLCAVLVDGARARIFLFEQGRFEERTDLVDDVPGKHDQGGRSQGRYQRHVDDHRHRHLKHTAEALFRLHKRPGFDHLVLAGPDEVLAEFEKELHDYLRQKVTARVSLPVAAPTEEILGAVREVEGEIERERERDTVAQLVAEASAGRQAVAGLEPTLNALAEARVSVLLVKDGFRSAGFACRSCGRLSAEGGPCPVCGGPMDDVPDVIEAAVVQALRQGCRVETVTEDGGLERLGSIGALLRF